MTALIVLGVVVGLLVVRSAPTAAAHVHRRRRKRNDAVLFGDCRRPSLNHLFRRLPASPRCRLCFAPFGGLGRVMRIRPSRKNPKFCDACFERAPVGGHEMDIGVLFADVRGFTALTEQQTPEETTALLNRLYTVATDVLVAHDAIIDKLVGDEVMALFLPQFPSLGDRTCDKMVKAAEELLRATAGEDGTDPWVRLGVGLTYGPAFVGNVGSGQVVKDFTAIGDTVNIAERLQASALGGQIVVSNELYSRLSFPYPDAQRESLKLKGKTETVGVFRLQPARSSTRR